MSECTFDFVTEQARAVNFCFNVGLCSQIRYCKETKKFLPILPSWPTSPSVKQSSHTHAHTHG